MYARLQPGPAHPADPPRHHHHRRHRQRGGRRRRRRRQHAPDSADHPRVPTPAFAPGTVPGQRAAAPGRQRQRVRRLGPVPELHGARGGRGGGHGRAVLAVAHEPQPHRARQLPRVPHGLDGDAGVGAGRHGAGGRGRRDGGVCELERGDGGQGLGVCESGVCCPLYVRDV